MSDAMSSRIGRAYAAFDAVQELDLAKVPATVIRTPGLRGFEWDFQGPLSDAEIENLAASLICNISQLLDHLKAWADRTGADGRRIDAHFRRSEHLKTMRDLCNGDKHSYPLKDPWTGRQIRLVNVCRIGRLTTRSSRGSQIGIGLASDGTPTVFGDGSIRAIITGDIVDDQGHRLGDLYGIAESAMDDWETLLIELGLLPRRVDRDL